MIHRLRYPVQLLSGKMKKPFVVFRKRSRVANHARIRAFCHRDLFNRYGPLHRGPPLAENLRQIRPETLAGSLPFC